MTLKAPSSNNRKSTLALSGDQTRGTRHSIHATPAVASRTEQQKASQVARALSSPATHPDAARRDSQREMRKIERMQVIEVEKTATWWESEHARNVCTIQHADELSSHLQIAQCPTSRPVVMSFFLPSCPGCKRMFPKLMQIAREHPQFDFVKVNTAHLQDECSSLNVNRLPYFKIWVAGEVVDSFTCTLSTIKELRQGLAAADRIPARHARAMFRSPSITEIPPLSSAVTGTSAASASSPAAAASASATAPAGTFRKQTECMHAPSHGCDGGPAGAVRGSGSRMPSIDDLVSHRCPEDSEPSPPDPPPQSKHAPDPPKSQGQVASDSSSTPQQ